MTTRLVLKGQIPSKKNSKRIVRFGDRPGLISSKQYEAWHEAAGWQLLAWKNAQQAKRGAVKWALSGVRVQIDFWPADNRRADLTNKAEGVMDLLVEHLILADDNMKDVPDVRLRFMGVDRKEPRAEITITTI